MRPHSPSVAALLALFGLLTLCGCRGTAPPAAEPAGDPPASARALPPASQSSSPGARPTPQQRSAAAAALGVERNWLASWFRGTPVQIAQRGDGAVVVEVPREFCFDPGESSVKPALGAVLDKVAESMARLRSARLPLLAAPADPGAATALALQRATKVRLYLLRRGVAAARLGPPVAAGPASMQLRMDLAFL